MRNFYQWLEDVHSIDEKGARTRLGPVPDSYGAAQYPPAYHMPIDAGAMRKLQTNHPKVLKNTNPPPKKKKKKR